MDSAAFLRHLTAQPGYSGQIAHKEAIPRRPAKHAELEKPLPAALEENLNRHELLPFYSHQAQAINRIRRGENVMVATASASGKTLCYNVPVVETLINERHSCALYLFPTKALAQDQLRTLYELFHPKLLATGDFATFDGDTPKAERGEIRRRVRLVVSNPDMLHLGILPNHQQWSRLFRRLKYVIVDEAHIYRGVFGSHVAGVLRRLRRLCRFYGANPRFILCSATIANPGEHAEKLVGLPFSVVSEDGSPHGGKDFVFWNPPLIDTARSLRRSANGEAANLLAELVGQDIRTLTFVRTRQLTEVIYNYTRRKLAEVNSALAKKIKPYRAGYLPEDRRKIEKELFSGQLTGVVATTALELGIDIGDLEATVLTGYPGSIASAWQQAGRSGRSSQKSLSFLIGLDNPLDQYFMRHPESFFGKSFENALVNPANHYILRAHLVCAAWELPLTDPDEEFFGATFKQERSELAAEGLLRELRGRWHVVPSIAYPAEGVNIRAAFGENYTIIDSSSGALLETIDSSTALFFVFPGAIYLHQGESYLVEKLDLGARTAYAKPVEVNYYTQDKELTDLHINKVLQEKDCHGTKVYLGEVEVTTRVVGFKKKAQFTEEIIGEEPLDLPPQHFPTIALWFDLPQKTIKRVDQDEAGLDFAGGLHAVEHAAIAILPMFALCDRNDIGGVSTPLHPDTGQPQVFIYDAYPGGIGIAERGFDLVEELWQTTLKAIEECPCEDGCPSCVQSPKCGNNNKPLDKKAALVLRVGLWGKKLLSRKLMTDSTSENGNITVLAGKGGVGKTTCAAAIALHRAGQGESTLAISTDATPSLAHIFELSNGAKPAEVKPGLHISELGVAEVREMWNRKFGREVYEVFSSFVSIDYEEFSEFMTSLLPGLSDEFMVDYIRELNRKGDYGAIVWDTAPLGQTLALLETPPMLAQHLKLAPRIYSRLKLGPKSHEPIMDILHRWEELSVENIHFLQDRVEFIIVTIAEALAVTQLEYVFREMNNHGLKVKQLVINNIIKDGDSAFMRAKSKQQQPYREAIHNRYSDLPIVEIPLFPHEVKGLPHLNEVAAILFKDGIG